MRKRRANKWRLSIKLSSLKLKLKTTPTPELKNFFNRREALKFLIHCNRKSAERIFDYSLGFKKLSLSPGNFYVRSKEEERRMMETLKNLHEQTRLLRKQMKEELENVNPH